MVGSLESAGIDFDTVNKGYTVKERSLDSLEKEFGFKQVEYVKHMFVANCFSTEALNIHFKEKIILALVIGNCCYFKGF